MTLHKSKYVKITLEKDIALIIDKFLPETETMTTEEFKKEMEIFADLTEKHKPEKELVHLLEMNFVIDPEIQKWMNEKIFPRYAGIIKRMAFLVPKEIFAQAAVEQTMEDEAGQKFTQKYFKTEEEARQWLNEA